MFINKLLTIIGILFWLCLSLFVNAQIKQSITKNGNATYVDAEGRAHFQAYFPDAKTLTLEGGDGLENIAKTINNINGTWYITTDPIGAGFHYYWFNIDGKRVNDPTSTLYFGYNQPTNGLEVPSSNDFFLEKNVRRGEIRTESYYSEIFGITRVFKIYLPPGKKHHLPVLYLYHGAGENITGWEKQGRLQNIMDNLLAEKKCVPMIVIMDSGILLTKNQEKLPNNQKRILLSAHNVDIWLRKELMPHIHKKYHTKKQIAIAGLSRGSFQALFTGINNPELFTAIGVFSPVFYSNTQDPFAELQLNRLWKVKSPPIIYLSVGAFEKERFKDYYQNFSSLLDVHNYAYQSNTSSQTHHEWHNWRENLYQFLQKIFLKS